MWTGALVLLIVGQVSGLSAEDAPLPDVAAICVSCRFDPEPLLQRYTDDEWGRLRSGRVLPRDIGKRVYDVGGVLQTENDEQFAARLESEEKST